MLHWRQAAFVGEDVAAVEALYGELDLQGAFAAYEREVRGGEVPYYIASHTTLHTNLHIIR